MKNNLVAVLKNYNKNPIFFVDNKTITSDQLENLYSSYKRVFHEIQKKKNIALLIKDPLLFALFIILNTRLN